MDTFRQPSPAEIDAYIRRAHALRSAAVSGFFRRLMRSISRRSATPEPAPRPAECA